MFSQKCFISWKFFWNWYFLDQRMISFNFFLNIYCQKISRKFVLLSTIIERGCLCTPVALIIIILKIFVNLMGKHLFITLIFIRFLWFQMKFNMLIYINSSNFFHCIFLIMLFFYSMVSNISWFLLVFLLLRILICCHILWAFYHCHFCFNLTKFLYINSIFLCCSIWHLFSSPWLIFLPYPKTMTNI